MATREQLIERMNGKRGGTEVEESASFSFSLPSSWTPPDEAVGGEEFELMIAGKLGEDGRTLTVTKIGGIPLEDEQEEVEEAEDEMEAEDDAVEDEEMSLASAMNAQREMMGM